jgi:hypothetical protein
MTNDAGPERECHKPCRSWSDAFIPARTAARIEEQTGRGVNRVIFCPPLKEIVSAPPAPIVKQEYVGSLVFLA